LEESLRTDSLARFLAYAARARANPKFDLEEREHRLEIAERLRGMLEAVRDGYFSLVPRAEHADPLPTVFLGTYGARPYALTLESEHAWLKAWAAADKDSLRDALIAFVGGGDAEHRFAHFSGLAEKLHADGLVETDPATVLAFGSLFNFAVEPGSLPVIRGPLFKQLERRLGYSTASGASAADQYGHHLAFARFARDHMERHGVPIRDMVDVQSLVWRAAQEPDAWASEQSLRPPLKNGRVREPVRTGGESPSHYLSICAIYRDEEPYLAEWIEFHRVIGADRFYLYNNKSSDAHLEVLAPYLESGTVVLHDWPRFPAGQVPAYDHCLREHGHDSRWIAFIDLDEFLFSPTARRVSDLLVEYEDWPGIGVNSANFGMSGHRVRPPGLVIENYLERGPLESNKYVKSIVDPSRAASCGSAHHFVYHDGVQVDENGYPFLGQWTTSHSLDRLRLNHYWTKSEEELRAKWATPMAANGAFRPWPYLRLLREQFTVTDDTILTYAPAVRDALASRGGARADVGSAAP
jgi:Glycosyltransferase family 92